MRRKRIQNIFWPCLGMLLLAPLAVQNLMNEPFRDTIALLPKSTSQELMPASPALLSSEQETSRELPAALLTLDDPFEAADSGSVVTALLTTPEEPVAHHSVSAGHGFHPGTSSLRNPATPSGVRLTGTIETVPFRR